MSEEIQKGEHDVYTTCPGCNAEISVLFDACPICNTTNKNKQTDLATAIKSVSVQN